MGLGSHSIDAASFTSLRLGSGALTLVVLVRLFARGGAVPRAGAVSAGALFGYAIAFSFAYDTLSTGTGALILFGSVQVTMLMWALRQGEQLSALAWLGFVMAALGLLVLVFPGLSAPSALGATLMALAGVAWGVYSLLGRGSRAPIADTARSFAWATPMSLGVSLLNLESASLSRDGVLLALASGVVTSGGGYAIWHAALSRLGATRAAALQLLVPVLAALGGVLLLSETLTRRLVVAALLVVGGVGLVVAVRARTSRRT